MVISGISETLYYLKLSLTKGLRTNQATHQRISNMGTATSMTDLGFFIVEVVGLLFFLKQYTSQMTIRVNSRWFRGFDRLNRRKQQFTWKLKPWHLQAPFFRSSQTTTTFKKVVGLHLFLQSVAATGEISVNLKQHWLTPPKFNIIHEKLPGP